MRTVDARLIGIVQIEIISKTERKLNFLCF